MGNPCATLLRPFEIYTYIMYQVYTYSYRAIIVSLYCGRYIVFKQRIRSVPISERVPIYTYIYIILCVVFVPVRNIVGVSHTILFMCPHIMQILFIQDDGGNVNPDGIRPIGNSLQRAGRFHRLQLSCTSAQEYIINTYGALTVNTNSSHNNLR